MGNSSNDEPRMTPRASAMRTERCIQRTSSSASPTLYVFSPTVFTVKRTQVTEREENDTVTPAPELVSAPTATLAPLLNVSDGPYTHEINRGNLDKIVSESQLKSSAARNGFGGEAVRGRTISLDKLQTSRGAIEFFTKEPPSVHPTNREASWSMPEGQRLDIKITRIKSSDGTIRPAEPPSHPPTSRAEAPAEPETPASETSDEPD